MSNPLHYTAAIPWSNSAEATPLQDCRTALALAGITQARLYANTTTLQMILGNRNLADLGPGADLAALNARLAPTAIMEVYDGRNIITGSCFLRDGAVLGGGPDPTGTPHSVGIIGYAAL